MDELTNLTFGYEVPADPPPPMAGLSSDVWEELRGLLSSGHARYGAARFGGLDVGTYVMFTRVSPPVAAHLARSHPYFDTARLRDADHAYLEYGLVRPGYRRLGVMRGMLQDIYRHGEHAGLRGYTLHVTADNEPAWRLYESEGFRTAKRIEYPHPSVPLLLEMDRPLRLAATPC